MGGYRVSSTWAACPAPLTLPSKASWPTAPCPRNRGWTCRLTRRCRMSLTFSQDSTWVSPSRPRPWSRGGTLLRLQTPLSWSHPVDHRQHPSLSLTVPCSLQLRACPNLSLNPSLHQCRSSNPSHNHSNLLSSSNSPSNSSPHLLLLSSPPHRPCSTTSTSCSPSISNSRLLSFLLNRPHHRSCHNREWQTSGLAPLGSSLHHKAPQQGYHPWVPLDSGGRLDCQIWAQTCTAWAWSAPTWIVLCQRCWVRSHRGPATTRGPTGTRAKACLESWETRCHLTQQVSSSYLLHGRETLLLYVDRTYIIITVKNIK